VDVGLRGAVVLVAVAPPRQVIPTMKTTKPMMTNIPLLNAFTGERCFMVFSLDPVEPWADTGDDEALLLPLYNPIKKSQSR
jgi:hypothetical protein